MSVALIRGQKSRLISSLQIGLAFLVCFVAINPIFHTLGIKGSALLALWLMITLAANKLKTSAGHFFIYMLAFWFLLTSLLTSAANMTMAPAVMSMFYVITIFTVLQLDGRQLERLINIATKIFIFFIIGAIIGMVYYQMGGVAVVTLTNPDGRDNSLYLTTFSNAETFTIRPSAVYDEPGAFSFFICVLVALRSRFRLSLPASYILLLGGLLTQSIAHVFFITLWLIWLVIDRFSKGRSEKIGSIFFGMVSFLLLVALVGGSGFLDWALERGWMYYLHPETNARFGAAMNIVNNLLINSPGLWFGFDIECIQRQSECTGMGENPLTPLVYGGLFAAWPYYFFIALSFIATFLSRDGLLLFGIAILLLQRPYLLEFPYSALLALVYLAWISNFNKDGPPLKKINMN
jgi:hypothetical protein